MGIEPTTFSLGIRDRGFNGGRIISPQISAAKLFFRVRIDVSLPRAGSV